MRNHSSILAAAITATTLSIPSAVAETYQAKSLSDMAKNAAVIVTGKVMNQSAEQLDGRVMTKVQVKVMDSIKGHSTQTITLEIPGGSFQSGKYKIGESHGDSSHIFSGQDAVFFLNKSTSNHTYSLTTPSQSFMTISDSKKGKAIQNELTKGKTLTIESLKNMIKTVEGEK